MVAERNVTRIQLSDNVCRGGIFGNHFEPGSNRRSCMCKVAQSSAPVLAPPTVRDKNEGHVGDFVDCEGVVRPCSVGARTAGGGAQTVPHFPSPTLGMLFIIVLLTISLNTVAPPSISISSARPSVFDSFRRIRSGRM